MLCEQGKTRHQKTRCAITTLQATGIQKRLLEWVQLITIGQTLHSGDLAAVRLQGQGQAGLDGLPVFEDCAGTTGAGFTTALGARQIKRVS